MKKLLVLLTAVIFLAMAVTTLQAFEKSKGKGMFGKRTGEGGGKMTGMGRNLNAGIFSLLDLSAEQKKSLKSLKLEEQKESIKLRAELEIKELDLREEMTNPSTDGKKVNSFVEDINGLRGKLFSKSVEFRIKAKSLLTREQIDKLSEGPSFKGRGSRYKSDKDYEEEDEDGGKKE